MVTVDSLVNSVVRLPEKGLEREDRRVLTGFKCEVGTFLISTCVLNKESKDFWMKKFFNFGKKG